MSDKTRRHYVQGTLTCQNGYVEQQVAVSSAENVIDSGKDYWGRFSVTKIFRSGGWVTGSGYGCEVDAPGSFYYWEGARAGDLGIEIPDTSLLAGRLFSSTNPSVPKFSISQFAGEMKDIPHMFRNAGRSLLKRAANGYISFRFAQSTLISDFSNLINITDDMDKRMRSLRNLRNTGKTVEKKDLYNMSGSHVWPNVTYSDRPYINGPAMGFGNVRCWGAVQYELDSDNYDIAHLDAAGLVKLAVASSYGLYGVPKGGLLMQIASISDVWELLPWSWFADYFTNIGDVAKMTDNRLGLKPVKAAIMTTMESNIFHLGGRRVDPWGWQGSVTPATVKRVEKSRAPVDWTKPPLAVKPLLSGRQIAILGAMVLAGRSR